FFCVALDIIIYPAPHSAPFRGKGFGDRDNKSEIYFKKQTFPHKLKGGTHYTGTAFSYLA
ncbi:MAG: hypothetical protein ACLSS3_11215, partial [[Eubacterium] siraeum]